ncbi:MAG TPA: hypothetical protein VFL90_13200 [Methylomirabilota bacterium]|nr:hypothetical protein [Methylomirabilota bacterium]
MEGDLEHLAGDLAALTQRFTDLGANLGEAARALEETGAPPADALVDALAGARTQFVQIRDDVLGVAETVAVAPSAPPESLGELESLLTGIAEAMRQRRRRAALQQARDAALATLDRVLEVMHHDDPAFAALVECQAKARQLRASLDALEDPSADARLTGSLQSFADLLTMIESRDALDDERYAQLEESVSRAFGRPLAVAVARGRLGFAGDVVEAAPAPAPPEPEPTLPTPRLELESATVAPVSEPEPPLAPEPAPAETPSLDTPAVEMPAVPMPALEMPELERDEPLPAPPAPEPVRAAEPARPAAPAAPVAEPADTSAPDETAQWWLAAWARWSGWKSTHEFAEVVKEELGKYPYLLSVPIQKSPEYDDGLLAYGYSILMDHVEKQKPGCVGNALNSLKPGQRRPVGDQLYDYLVAEGRLAESYADFVRSAVLAAVPEPGLWFQFRILESKEDTRIFQRPSARIGDTELSGQRLASDAQRYAEHKFKMTLGPLTTRFVLVSAEIIRDARGVGVKLSSDGAPSDCGWLVAVPAAIARNAKVEARRVAEEGTHLPGLGKDYAAVWLAVFNPDAGAERRYELSVFLRKDTKSPFRGRA